MKEAIDEMDQEIFRLHGSELGETQIAREVMRSVAKVVKRMYTKINDDKL